MAVGPGPVQEFVHLYAGMDAGSREPDSGRGEADGALHAKGTTCGRCGCAFTDDDPVRRLVTGELVHDAC
jgi:hypothetical protein